MVFVADDLAAWLIAKLADASRRRLTSLVLGSDQERALRQVATAAVQLTAQELRPEGGDKAEDLAMVISQVFGEPVPGAPAGQATLLEALQTQVAGQLAVLDDPDLTGTGKSSADLLGVRAEQLAQQLTGHLVRGIIGRGARGGPLAPLADQLNHDATHLQAQRVEAKVDQLIRTAQEALARHPSLPNVPGVHGRASGQPAFPDGGALFAPLLRLSGTGPGSRAGGLVGPGP